MEYLTTVYSDKGIRKETNQDSALVKVARLKDGEICLAAICDGMGGLAKGELASATVIRALDIWFEQELPKKQISSDFEAVKIDWTKLIDHQNQLILDYGNKNGMGLGTTLSVILIYGGKYLFAHVGDSRIYKMTAELELLTKDQTVVARDLERGLITPDQAENDPRKNVLLQCIGASRVVVPQFGEGEVKPGEAILLCSDGFIHELSQKEIVSEFNPKSLKNEKVMMQKSEKLVELCKERKEKDNITVSLVKLL